MKWETDTHGKLSRLLRRALETVDDKGETTHNPGARQTYQIGQKSVEVLDGLVLLVLLALLVALSERRG